MAAERSGGGRRRAGTAATAAEGRWGLREGGAADLGLLYLAGPELKSARSGLTRVGRGLLGRLRRRAQAAGTAGDGTGGEASARKYRLSPGVASRSQEAAEGGEGGDGDDGGKGGGAFPVAGLLAGGRGARMRRGGGRGCGVRRRRLERSDPDWRPADAVDASGVGLLHSAIAQGRPDLVQLLLEFGADV
ncbi:uncharacterized protein LOC109704265 [Ananas comosus]|uniref:Uncharacterized protein LOC109704265 n=1 Tax=Ananas comosus TaxID=4615 RepID=A0A6P5EBB9_ANACO|nr:uncharacterized protein LOC109704265 [Ananas comosus]